jgi:hypothetical protein
MRKLFIPIVVAVILLIALFGALRVARARGLVLPGQGGEVVLKSETLEGNTRQITAPEGASPAVSDPNLPLIGFIDSPTAACVQPDPAKNECFINWYYIAVDANPNYMVTMIVNLNDFGFVARYDGFFQTSMYAPYNMNPQGYKVVCGAPGVGGFPGWGKSYSYTIRARDSNNLGSANYGTVVCPPYTP